MTLSSSHDVRCSQRAPLLGRHDIGKLAPGKAAGSVGFCLGRLDCAGALHDALAALVFRALQGMDLCMINGRAVIRGRHLFTVDLESAMERHNQIARRSVSGQS
jgi:cytosine/adenosine deaminase-related metal-dependent hydrolase